MSETPRRSSGRKRKIESTPDVAAAPAAAAPTTPTPKRSVTQKVGGGAASKTKATTAPAATAPVSNGNKDTQPAPADGGYAAGLGGIRLANGSYITHGAGMNVKTVFADLGFPVTMNELWPGTGRAGTSDAGPALQYGGQLGLIDFDTSIRLPRHVHIAPVQDPHGGGGPAVDKFIHERILVLEGVALVEMNGEVYVVPPRTLVTIAPGVPHTWTACPAGVALEEAVGRHTGSDDGKKTVSTGTFLMVYEYEDPTSFRPTRQTHTLASVDEYVACETEGLDEIRIPLLDADAVRERCWFLYDTEVKKAVKA